jgi:chemotaxis protein MotB
MVHKNKQSESDEAPGAPEWMVTFSDCMTLLLTFFVLLLSFSSFDEKVFQKLRMIFMQALPGVDNTGEENRDAIMSTPQIELTPALAEGSEKPTLERGLEDNSKEDTEPSDFRRLKVFSISSESIFWGNGTLISSEGHNIMAKLASFLKEVPSRVVVSENGPLSEGNGGQFGLPRAWAIVEYLINEKNLDKKRFSISTASTLSRESLSIGDPARASPKSERTVEVVLLERSIYN